MNPALRWTGWRCLPVWLGLLLCLALPVTARPVLKIEATPRELALGESLQLQITLIQEANERGGMIDTPNLSLPDLPGFEMQGQQTSSSTMMSNNRMRMMVQAEYRLRPLKSGDLEIPSLTFQFNTTGKQEDIKTQAIKIHVKGSSPSPALLWLLPALAICGAGIWWLRRKQPPRDEPVSVPARPRQGSLEALETRLSEGEDPQVLLEELYDWFRQLAYRRHWASALGATHQEIITTLRYESGVPADKLQAVEQFLQACEQMRYANHDIAPERFRHLLELARKFC